MTQHRYTQNVRALQQSPENYTPHSDTPEHTHGYCTITQVQNPDTILQQNTHPPTHTSKQPQHIQHHTSTTRTHTSKQRHIRHNKKHTALPTVNQLHKKNSYSYHHTHTPTTEDIIKQHIQNPTQWSNAQPPNHRPHISSIHTHISSTDHKPSI